MKKKSWLSWLHSRARSHIGWVYSLAKTEIIWVSYDVSQLGSREICPVIGSLVVKYK